MFDESYNSGTIIAPPKKITRSDYICSKHFYLDPILDMYEEGQIFGVALVSGCRSIFYKVDYAKGNTGTVINKKKVYDKQIKLQKSQKKGGQSAQRIGRIRDEKENNYVKGLVEKIRCCFESQVVGIVVGGPAEIKNKVVNHPEYKKYFGKITLEVVDTVEVDNSTILDVLNRSEKGFQNSLNKEAVELIKRVKKMMELADDKLIFGFKEAVENLKMCMVETLVVSKSVKNQRIETLKTLNQYGCPILIVDNDLLDKVGVRIVGIKFY